MLDRYLSIEDVSVIFPDRKGPSCVLEHIDLKITQGEFVSIIGHSGCGKSTLLNVVAGLVPARSGGVMLENKEVDAPGPDRAMVFQSHSLFPWMSVYANVRLAVDRVFGATRSRRQRHDWTLHNLDLVHMGDALDKYPRELSGGMEQRVGIARALAMEPKVLLMDEPFGSLDALTRADMQDSLMEIQSRLNNTVLMVTHDVDEAVLLSDRIVMMTNGPAARIGEILEIDLLRPRDRVELADNSSYHHYRAEVLTFLYRHHARPERVAAARGAEAPVKPPVAAKPSWKADVTLGFIPLTDCAPLVVAREKGYFRSYGLNVTLSRQTSWANILDKLNIGLLDGAQMLAGLPIATNLGLIPGVNPMITALSLDLNGNAITVSEDLYQRMLTVDPEAMAKPETTARALKRIVDFDKSTGKAPLSFGTVHSLSSHNYLLRYWMAAAGIDPDRDVRLVVVPPPQMVNHLRARNIAGFCVGEPWSGHAVHNGLGRILITSYEIWNNHPEKVFGATREWAERHPSTHKALLMALLEAAQWLELPENRLEAAALIAGGKHVDAPVEVITRSLSGGVPCARGDDPRPLKDFNVFYRHAATFPWRSHALWFITQMQRWNQLRAAPDMKSIAEAAYRTDIYREAANTLGIPYPTRDYKSEGGHHEDWTLFEANHPIRMGADCFLDGGCFDPECLADYLTGFQSPRLETPHVDVKKLFGSR